MFGKSIYCKRPTERKNPRLVSNGVFRAIECKWRIVLDNGVYYYDVSQFDRFEGVDKWVNILHSCDLADCLAERNNDLRRYGEQKKGGK